MAMSKAIDLARFVATNGIEHKLQKILPGWETAGSGTRTVKEGYRVRYTLKDGTTGSTWHNTFEDANARFMRICGRDGA